MQLPSAEPCLVLVLTKFTWTVLAAMAVRVVSLNVPIASLSLVPSTLEVQEWDVKVRSYIGIVYTAWQEIFTGQNFHEVHGFVSDHENFSHKNITHENFYLQSFEPHAKVVLLMMASLVTTIILVVWTSYSQTYPSSPMSMVVPSTSLATFQVM